METQFKRLNQSLQKYKALQEKQMALFDTELLPDLGSLRYERASTFAELKNHLDHFLNLLHYDSDLTDFTAFFLIEINHIMAGDDQLREKIVEYQKQLKEHMSELNKTKTALHGYANTAKSGKTKQLKFTG